MKNFCRNLRKRSTLWGSVLLLALGFLFPGKISAEPVPGNGVILIVASYNPDTRRMSDFIAQFEEELGQKLPFRLIVEDMGCKGVAEAPLWKARMGDILTRYEDEKLRAVILLGQEAWASFLAQDDFPDDIPFFGCFASENGIRLPGEGAAIADWMPPSVDMIARADSMGLAGGCLNRYDLDKNIDLITALYPDVEHIAFVSDNTYGGISLQAMVREQDRRFPEIDFIFVDGRKGLETAIRQIAELPRNSVILLGTWRVGREGEYLMYSAMENLVAANPTIPVFTLSGTGFGSAAIGGYIPSYHSGAGEIFDQISGYYTGKPDAVGFEVTGGEYRFERKKLQDFGIEEYKLPRESIIVDSTEAQFRKYRNYITLGFSVTVVLASLSIFLYYLNIKNKTLTGELQKREAELIRAKERAEESDRLKSAFLANMSHEIRTPLNAIVGFSSLLAGDLSPQERDEYNQIILTNSELMLTLISDILDISRLETDRIEFAFEETDIVQLCRQVILTTAHNRNPGVKCVLECSYESYLLRTDVKRLSQVLINLLTNAGKFTEQGTITVSFEEVTGTNMVRFSVTDTGCGIPAGKQALVFNRFEKLDEFKQGTGLGLAICKQICLRFGGKIWVDSDYTNGSRFVFTHSTEL